MNKTELIAKIAAEGGITKKEASKLIDILFESISATLTECTLSINVHLFLICR